MPYCGVAVWLHLFERLKEACLVFVSTVKVSPSKAKGSQKRGSGKEEGKEGSQYV